MVDNREIPPPNRYEIKSGLSKIAYSIGQKSKENINSSPGPGCYEDVTPTNNWSKGAALGKETRFHSQSSGNLL